MDKFTVDLDKVLNDFEYSELTDQYVKTNSLQNTQYSTSHFKPGPVKHSINNVFHSLNEYLNSDVADKCENVALSHDNTSDLRTQEVDDSESSDSTEETNEIEEEVIEAVDEKCAVDVASLETTEAQTVAELESDVSRRSEDVTSDKGVVVGGEVSEEAEVVCVEVPERIESVENVESASESDEHFEVAKEHKSVIGFDDTIQIEDSELNKYLDALEAELNEPQAAKTEIVAPEPEVKGKEIEISPERDETVPETETEMPADECVEPEKAPLRPDSLPLEEIECVVKRDINLIGDPGSTPYNNVYSLNELPQKSEQQRERNDTAECSSQSSESDFQSDGSTTPSTETLNDDEVVGSEKPQVMEAEVETERVEEENASGFLLNFPKNLADAKGVSNEDEDGSGDRVSDTVEELSRMQLMGEEPVRPTEEVFPQLNTQETRIGKQAPLWVPDSETLNCLHCDMKFTVIKRRHHCRACGLVLCSKCCNSKYRLEYLQSEARVCAKCYEILNRDSTSGGSSQSPSGSPFRGDGAQPNPNNPMEYCSTVPPAEQVSGSSQNPPTVMVPVGVLKRTGSSKGKSNKSVMFCDGIRPGSDLTNLDSDFNYGDSKGAKRGEKGFAVSLNRNLPAVDAASGSYIPDAETSLPPTVAFYKLDISYSECGNNSNVVEMLKNESLTFAIQRNLYVHVKIINMDCCINRHAWCFSTEGLIDVGQDEIVILLEVAEDERTVPKDVFYHINNIYADAVKGTTVKELGLSLHDKPNFLGSKNHAGFLFIRPSFQCLQQVIVPKEQYLIGILIHRWETPWAKIFPLRLVLRLGAEYRYYPSPIICTRQRESVFVEIGHTIINLLADFRNFSYTLPQIRGLTIHMEDKNTTVTIPVNRYDQVMKSVNNSSDHILAFGGNFSTKADAHLVCIQDTHANTENSYSTHAINIHNRPRKVTALSFIVFNGALKTSSGLTAKSSIVEDGLMVQVPAENLVKIRESLRNMRDHTIQCGCVNAASDETVSIVWGEADCNFNVGVLSPIDEQPMSGVPSIRVHNGKDYVCNNGNRLIRWTEVFILQNGEENSRSQDPVDVSKISESIAKATCQALVKYLDLLLSNNSQKIGVRVTLHVENVAYSAGSNSTKLAPIYMRSLDDELIPVLHRITSNNLGENAVVLELIFRILNV